ncbi:MAG: hypothetical protein QOF01_5136 [Thermomicrobiales bacterium]|jgi:hypothetical protein|nr:hypothetical protein [Thermomicrobiales bacterium]
MPERTYRVQVGPPPQKGAGRTSTSARGWRSAAAGPGRSCRRRARAGAPKKPGSASGSTPSSWQRGGDRCPRRGATCGEYRRLSRRDGAGGGQEPPRLACDPARSDGERRARAKQDIDDGRRGRGTFSAPFVRRPVTPSRWPPGAGRSPTGSRSCHLCTRHVTVLTRAAHSWVRLGGFPPPSRTPFRGWRSRPTGS